MGAWVIGAVPDEGIRELLRTAVRTAPPTPPPVRTGVSEGLARWRRSAQEPLFSARPGVPGQWTADEAFRLSAFLDGCHDDSGPVEALRDAVVDHFPPDGEGLFAVSARKASPFSALAYAIGPDAVLQLPGWFGDFLLDSGEVRDRLPAAEEALGLTGSRRREAVERIRAWMTGLGDDPDHDADKLLDGPLRVLRHAARTGRGAAGQVRWY
ncbi:hypothetical protein GCM10025734_64550 [Kitasatospora paranensis]